MFKIIGGILVMVSTVFVFSQKVLEYRFTYNFVNHIKEITSKIQYESTLNQTYEKVFEKIDFDIEKFFSKAKGNGYIQRKEIRDAEIFFNGLGKRDRTGEQEYIVYNLKKFEIASEKYLSQYNETRKTHLLCGLSAGFIIIIFFI